MKFSIKNSFSKCDQICKILLMWSHLLKKFLMEIFLCVCVWWSLIQPATIISLQSLKAVARKCSVHKIHKIPATLFKKRLWHRCFPLNFGKFLGTPSFTEHLRWLYSFSIKHLHLCASFHFSFLASYFTWQS